MRCDARHRSQIGQCSPKLLFGCRGDFRFFAVQQVRDPILRPGQFRFVVDSGERLEANFFTFAAQVEEIAAHRQRHCPAACALVEDVNAGIGIAQPLAGEQIQKR